MSETHLVLIFMLATFAVVMLAWLTLFSVVSAKSRIIREQRKALKLEQQLHLAQLAFTANAHHELRTPLQIISGSLYMLGTMHLNDGQEKMLARAESATQRLQNLVQDLLAFTALQQGTLILNPDVLDLNSHLKTLAKDYESSAQAKGLDFQAEIEEASTLVICDWPRLRRAFAALLDNALRFTDKGSIQMTVKVKHSAAKCSLRFEVADTGIGLPSDWTRLLSPFVQETESPHRIPEGLGIGLALAKSLIEQMGGSLGLTPLPTGTLAWIEVRLDEATI